MDVLIFKIQVCIFNFNTLKTSCVSKCLAVKPVRIINIIIISKKWIIMCFHNP